MKTQNKIKLLVVIAKNFLMASREEGTLLRNCLSLMDGALYCEVLTLTEEQAEQIKKIEEKHNKEIRKTYELIKAVKELNINEYTDTQNRQGFISSQLNDLLYDIAFNTRNALEQFKGE